MEDPAELSKLRTVTSSLLVYLLIHHNIQILICNAAILQYYNALCAIIPAYIRYYKVVRSKYSMFPPLIISNIARNYSSVCPLVARNYSSVFPLSTTLRATVLVCVR